MSDSLTVCSPIPMNWVHLSSQDPIGFLRNLDDLLDDFGPEQLGNAATRQFFERFADNLKKQIDASDLPTAMKELARDVVDSHLERTNEQCPCSVEASEAVSNCAQSEQINEAADQACSHCCAGHTANDEANGSTEASESQTDSSCAGSSSSSGSDQAAGSTESMTPAEQAEATQEAENEGRPTPAASGADVAAQANAQSQADEEKTKHSGNWLEVLAKNLADIQSKFLDKALAASEDMANESDNIDIGGSENTGDSEESDSTEGSKSNKFLEAQSRFTANMQLFNLFANQSATALKTVGEGMSAIARKQ